jgi:uncharacterized Zn-binding protein involved in type VI secretion
MVTPGLPPIPHVGGPILPPGQPTVLIAGMPASVVGDMCICVGPPDAIAMGSTGVTIGGRPAARMGDPTVHGGMIAVGCPTVLIGETGGGGGGAGSANASAGATAEAANATAASAAAAVAAAQSQQAQELVSALSQSGALSPRKVDPTKKAWVEIEVVDETGAPVAYQPYRIEAPDGEVCEGWTDANGVARIEGVVPGTCKVTLTNLDEKAWDPA